MNEFNIPENRGAAPKYNFDGLLVGDHRSFSDAKNTQVLLNCAKSYAKIRGLHWAFKCYTDPRTKDVVIVRVK